MRASSTRVNSHNEKAYLHLALDLLEKGFQLVHVS